jgi:hypothetical protein
MVPCLKDTKAKSTDMDKRWTLTKRSDRILWQQCVAVGGMVGGLAGLPFHWHALPMFAAGMFLGNCAGIWAFYPLRRWKRRRDA